MERQSKEESQALWKLERESAKLLELTPEHKALIDAVSSKIDDYSLTYNEYVQDIASYLEKITSDEDPREMIKNMCIYLTQKYNGQEVRSEQSKNGSSTIKRRRRSRKNPNNGC